MSGTDRGRTVLPGHSLVNSVDGSSGTFSATLQQCRPCTKPILGPGTSCAAISDVISGTDICLRACYAVSGTELAYGATRGSSMSWTLTGTPARLVNSRPRPVPHIAYGRSARVC
eukprot:3375935-Rhodomonas_salina.11